MNNHINKRALQMAFEKFTDVVENQIAQAVELLAAYERTARLSEIAETLKAQQDSITKVWLRLITDEITRAEKQARRMKRNRKSYSARGPLEKS